MAAIGGPARSARFDRFELDRQACELSRDGRRIHLQILPFRVLEILVDNAGQAVSRKELRDRIWPSNVFIDFDHSLNNAVARLREVLEDSAEAPRFIETLPRIGYRFVCPVTADEPQETSTASVPAATPATAPRRWFVLWTLLFVAVVVTSVIWLLQPRPSGSSGGEAIRSVAVLPFRNLSGDAEQDFFAAGMTGALITQLAGYSSLRVVSRRSGARYEDPDIPVARIARELRVDLVIDGAILRDGENLRVDIQLIRAKDDRHVWARSYQRQLQNVLDFQRELAADIAEELSPNMGGVQVRTARTDNFAAYEAYLRGRYLHDQRNLQSVEQALGYFQQAVELDPSFAAAYAEMAKAYVAIGGNSIAKSKARADTLPAALAAARRALELDDGLATAHSALAAVHSSLSDRTDVDKALVRKEFETAIALDPGDARTHHMYGNFLSSQGYSDEAVERFRHALALEPMSPHFMSRLGKELVDTGIVSDGLALLERAVEFDPHLFNARVRLGWIYAGLSRFDEAEREFEAAAQISPDSPYLLAGLAFVAAKTGDDARAREILMTLQPLAEKQDEPFTVAIVYVGLQDRANALTWLEKAAQSTRILHKSGLYGWNDPLYDWLRADPRFIALRGTDGNIAAGDPS